ncbi:MAG: DUF885 family protein [Nocardioidaceae bacterium]
MTASPSTAPRRVDAIAEQFVEDYAALDPLTATFIGISGHDGELADLSPQGYQQRQQLTQDALGRMRGAQANDQREQAARDSFVERLTVSLEQYAAHTPQSQVSVVTSELHSLRGVFDLMSTEGRRPGATSTPG